MKVRFAEFVGANPIYDARAFLFGGGEIGPHTLAAILHSALHLHPSGSQHLDGGSFLANSPRWFLRSFLIRKTIYR